MTSKSAGYTKPELRERIKSRVMASGDGGKPGQWSARKAQLVAQKYESAGGGYSGAKTEGQKSLSKWTDQKWTTSDGKPAERKGGTTRYLPEKAWDKLSPGERAATNAKKREGSRKGEQFVANTEAAAEARKEAVYKSASESGAWQRSEGKNPEGGLNAKGRASLKAQGHDIKPGVKGPADTPEKMKRKGSFLSRMFGPGAPGSMKKDNGEPSRRALSAKAWGEPVPQDDAGRARLYAKGQALLKRYEGKKKEAADQAFVAVLSHYGLHKLAAHRPAVGFDAHLGVGGYSNMQDRVARRIMRDRGWNDHHFLKVEPGRRPTDYRRTPGKFMVPGEYHPAEHMNLTSRKLMEQMGASAESIHRLALPQHSDPIAQRAFKYQDDPRTRQPAAMKTRIRENIARMQGDKYPGIRYIR